MSAYTIFLIKVSSCHWAVSNSDYKMLKYLLENGADWTIKDADDRSALHYAVGVETTKCLQAIVKYVTPEQKPAINSKDVDGISPLVMCRAMFTLGQYNDM